MILSIFFMLFFSFIYGYTAVMGQLEQINRDLQSLQPQVVQFMAGHQSIMSRASTQDRDLLYGLVQSIFSQCQENEPNDSFGLGGVINTLKACTQVVNVRAEFHKKQIECEQDRILPPNVFRYEGKVLQRVNAAGTNNKCFYYSAIQGYQDFLTQIFGGVLPPYYKTYTQTTARSGPGAEAAFDFKRVQERVHQTIMLNLDTQHQVLYLCTNEIIEISIKEVLVDMMRRSKAPQGQSVEAFLNNIWQNNEIVDQEFAIILWMLYGRPIYVLHKNPYKGDDPDDPYKRKLFVEQQYGPVSVDDQKPIYVWHEGFHYQKLIPLS